MLVKVLSFQKALKCTNKLKHIHESVKKLKAVKIKIPG